MTEWISVNDRLPELKAGAFETHYESDFVLIAHEGEESETMAPTPWIGYMDMYGEMNKPEWGLVGELGIGKVTHWTPLPNPPN